MFWHRYAALTDDELERAALAWAASERRLTLDILGILIAMDDRSLPVRKGYSTLFKFCIEKLRFSEAVAFWRIRTARAAVKYPRLAGEIEAGTMNITTITILSAYLTDENNEELISDASGKTRKDVEALAASLSPSAPRRDVVTRQGPMIVARSQWPPAPDGASMAGAAAGPGGGELQKALDIVEALDAERRRLHFDVGPDTAELLERARQILRHKYPFASLEDIVREALNVLLDHKDFERSLDKGRPRPADAQAAEAGAGAGGTGSESSRTIPMWVRREVWKRDSGRCAYVGADGVCCDERSWLEFDHVVPFAKGGRSDDPANIRLLCRAHNQLEARRAFGPAGSA